MQQKPKPSSLPLPLKIHLKTGKKGSLGNGAFSPWQAVVCEHQPPIPLYRHGSSTRRLDL